MDSPRDTRRPEALESETASGREPDRDGGRDRSSGDRDLRDVLARLVVVDGDRENISLEAIATAAGGSDRLVPTLLGALDDETTAIRVGAAWTLCALADDRPAAASYLAERVAERMDGDEPFEVGQVLSYLRGRYPGRVADALDLAAAQDSLGEPRDDRTDHHPSTQAERNDPEPDSVPGSETDTAPPVDGPEGKRIETDGGVPAGTVADLGDGRQVVRPSGESSAGHQRPPGPDQPPRPGVAQSRTRTPDASTRNRDSQSAHPTDPGFEPDARSTGQTDSANPAQTDRTGPAKTDRTGPAKTDRTGPAKTDRTGSTPTDPAGPPVTERDHRPETPETFASIAALSEFDRLSAVDRGVETRYATGYRCRAATDDEERGVATRLFDRPSEGDRLDFRADLADCLARWEALGDGDHVVAVVDWGERPRPWVATQPVDATLADRGRPSIDTALDQAVTLTECLAYCHRHGVVHGGLDPENVVYPGDGLTGLDHPILDNPGLMDDFRTYFEPADYLDPRFAAPEYFDDAFGTVDAGSDVYGLGAVCYFLLTGRPPFDGSYAAIRRGVVGEAPTAPSAVRDAVPAELDPVVAKALAKEKIRRYDSVETFAGDLRRVRDRSV